MRKSLLFLLVLLSTYAFGQLKVDEVRNVKEFTNIKAANGVRVYLVKGTPGEVRISSKGIHLSDIITEVHGKTLKLSIDSWSQLREKNWHWDVEIEVPVENLEGITSVTGARVSNNFTLEAHELRINSNTGGELDLDVNCRAVDITANTGAILSLKGYTENLEVTSNMGSEVDLGKLRADYVYAKAGMGGDLEVYAIKEADIYASMGGSIDVYGNPARYYTHKSMGGDISPDHN